ncbi:MAG: hypothetical protein ACRD3V_20330 [Vicinamibacteria bacterium]
MRDLTSRRAAELELRDSRERYRSILQNLRGIAYRVTAGEFQPLFLGGSVFEITGRRSEEMTAPRFQPAAAAAAAGGELEEIVQNVERMLGRIIGEDIELETRLEARGRVRADASQIEPYRPRIPVLYISGYAGEERTEELLQDGAAFLPKPFTAAALAGKVRQVLTASELTPGQV